MKKANLNQGITLIALVITIIVLLILAGVSISMVTGDNGIAQKALDAKEKTNEANADEEQKLQDAVDYIDSKVSGSTGDSLAVGTVVTGSNRTLTGGDATYKNPIIPVGFKAVNDGASWTISDGVISGWNDGLVIEDEEENQFVWVPVDGTNVPYSKWCYDSNGYGLTYTDVTGDDVVSGVTETDQITKYGGFWIGRYEAGRSDVDTATTTTNNITSGVELLIQKGAQPWNLISYTNAKTVAEAYVSNSNVKSGLVTGTQWDSAMKWIENAGYDVTTDSTSWGNYYNNTSVAGTGRYSTSTSNSHIWTSGAFSKTGNSTLFTGTGLYEDSKAKNIYDLAGNMWEWTAEQYSGDFVDRGGGAYHGGGDFPAGFRTYGSSSATRYLVGFRVVLYVM